MTALRIAVVKPDYGMAGGFERLLDRLVDILITEGHDIHHRSFPGVVTPRPVWGIPEASTYWRQHPEFFRYLALTEEVRRMELDDYDLVLSTQPPTFLADHPRVLALFYHQARIFYDLADRFSNIDQVSAAHHNHATALVRSVDREHLGGVRHWLAGSTECANRLEQYWGVQRTCTSLLHAPALSQPEQPTPWNPAGPVLCVSRHEWPKRTELMAAAAVLMPDRVTTIIGGGTRQSHVEQIAGVLAGEPSVVTELDPEDLWMNPAAKPPPFGSAKRLPRRMQTLARRAPWPPGLKINGWTSDEARDEAYRTAAVVVAPAYREDYGLTALEAMLWQRPVIVCRDGGGLVDLVNETGAGLVVDPTPAAIVAGIRRVVESPELARDLQARAQAVPHTFTWERCRAELTNAVEQALSAPASG